MYVQSKREVNKNCVYSVAYNCCISTGPAMMNMNQQPNGMPYISTENVTIKSEPTSFAPCANATSTTTTMAAPDSNANVQDTERLLQEVKQTPAAMRNQLLSQVTETVITAHMATCINTYANVAAANKNVDHMIENDLMVSESVLSQFLV